MNTDDHVDGRKDTGTLRYLIKAFLAAFVISPLILSLGAIADLVMGMEFIGLVVPLFFLLSAILVLWRWALFARVNELPGSFIVRYLPFLAAFGYYTLAWIVAFDPRGDDHFRSLSLPWVVLPQFVPLTLLSVMDKITWFPYLQVALYGSIALTVSRTSRECRKPLTEKRGAVAAALFVAVLTAICAYRNFERDANTLPFDHEAEKTAANEKRLYFTHRPFTKDNRLRPLEEGSTLTFASDYPVLDGATSALPIYGSAAEMIYRGLDEGNAQSYVRCSQTARAYDHLIAGRVDIFFGLQPSPQQREAAARNGREFVLTPIARDAFVFFVNRENPVNSLTTEQIRDIYLKKITSWEAVGGIPGKIVAFQRPDGSGSQTIMLAEVMRGKSLPLPPSEMRAATMGTVIRRVAGYRNYTSAIGYSFFYYATVMNPDPDIKLLAVDGVAPTPETIRTSAYPLTVNVYAVTAGTRNENAAKLIDWFRSEQGQRLVEKVGYVGLEEGRVP